MYQESRPIIKESNRSKSTTIFNRLLANDLFGQKRKARNELILEIECEFVSCQVYISQRFSFYENWKLSVEKKDVKLKNRFSFQ